MERDLVKSWSGEMDKLNSHGTWCCHCKLTSRICWVTALRCDCVRERCGMPRAKRRKNVSYFQHLNGFAQLQKSYTLFTFAGIQSFFLKFFFRWSLERQYHFHFKQRACRVAGVSDPGLNDIKDVWGRVTPGVTGRGSEMMMREL